MSAKRAGSFALGIEKGVCSVNIFGRELLETCIRPCPPGLDCGAECNFHEDKVLCVRCSNLSEPITRDNVCDSCYGDIFLPW